MEAPRRIGRSAFANRLLGKAGRGRCLAGSRSGGLEFAGGSGHGEGRQEVGALGAFMRAFEDRGRPPHRLRVMWGESPT